MQTTVPLYGFGGVPYSAVRKAAPRNLLDNSDFRNPVNQRGQTSYTLNAWGGYCIDRWRAGEQALTLTINGNGCTLRGEIYQTIDPKGNAKNLNGKTVTIAAKVNGSIGCRIGRIELTGAWDQFADFSIPGGRCYIYADSNNDLHVGLTANDTVTVEWVALYEGEYTAETLPEYQPKGYVAEELQCKRFFGVVNDWSTLIGAVTWENKLNAILPWPVEMRANPVGTVFKASLIVDGTYIDFSDSPLSVMSYPGFININFGSAIGSDHKSKPAAVSIKDTKFFFSVDL